MKKRDINRYLALHLMEYVYFGEEAGTNGCFYRRQNIDALSNEHIDNYVFVFNPCEKLVDAVLVALKMTEKYKMTVKGGNGKAYTVAFEGNGNGYAVNKNFAEAISYSAYMALRGARNEPENDPIANVSIVGNTN